jgi:hypothetical protein
LSSSDDRMYVRRVRAPGQSLGMVFGFDDDTLVVTSVKARSPANVANTKKAISSCRSTACQSTTRGLSYPYAKVSHKTSCPCAALSSDKLCKRMCNERLPQGFDRRSPYRFYAVGKRVLFQVPDPLSRRKAGVCGQVSYPVYPVCTRCVPGEPGSIYPTPSGSRNTA